MRYWHPPPKNYDPQFGDYPNLPWIPYDQRDPFQHWDDPVHRRNFGETLHEEFDIQDGFFQGEHKPMKNLWEGLKGQAILLGTVALFFGLAYLIHDPDQKPPKNELPPEVQEYLQNKGWERVNKNRVYQVPKIPLFDTLAVTEYEFPERKTDYFGRPIQH